jgi:hypothetical protein
LFNGIQERVDLSDDFSGVAGAQLSTIGEVNESHHAEDVIVERRHRPILSDGKSAIFLPLIEGSLEGELSQVSLRFMRLRDRDSDERTSHPDAAAEGCPNQAGRDSIESHVMISFWVAFGVSLLTASFLTTRLLVRIMR